ncbi:helix-turn-helix domain-containing protein [uncultured Adlercreutzia sp.]|uniref:helix-turn-helix domain-containing protein n=1 Tax=uncultured Adlercreutzia sp. TaxID=875803 RepID=UPI0026F3E21B|nr:helix-turn-helix transcriptional regulator [uncultured Adlercreutzia sp.]
MSAYDESYLQPARANLGHMLEVATDDLGFGLGEFHGMFIASGLAARFGAGDYGLITGCSGAELAFHVVEEVGLPRPQRSEVRCRYDRGPEYWCGWALARYQWKTALAFGAIERFAPVEDVVLLYDTYHEMDVRHLDDWLDARRRNYFARTPLRMRRMAAGMSQSQLARESGVPVRSIQQYEQRRKELNKAAAETVVRLARALFCSVEDLLE